MGYVIGEPDLFKRYVTDLYSFYGIKSLSYYFRHHYDTFIDYLVYYKKEFGWCGDFRGHEKYYIGKYVTGATSIIDKLTYTTLAYVAKSEFNKAEIYVTEKLAEVFQGNPHINGIVSHDEVVEKSVDVRPFSYGNVYDRACRVLGFNVHDFSVMRPILFYDGPPPTNEKYVVVSFDKLKYNIHVQSILKLLKDGTNEIKLAIIPPGETDIAKVMAFVKHSLFYFGEPNFIAHIAKAFDIPGFIVSDYDPTKLFLPLLDTLFDDYTREIIKPEKEFLLYLIPGFVHFNVRTDTYYSPLLTEDNFKNALDGLVFPYNNAVLYDYNFYYYLWSNITIGDGVDRSN